MNKQILLIPALLLLTACNGAPTKTDSSAKDSLSHYNQADLTDAGFDYVGMTLEEAQAKAKAENTAFRVTKEDGQPMMVTMDYQPGRINAAVQNGVVESYTVEGTEHQETYDQNSWKKLISQDCQTFFDGCNNCQRIKGSDEAACTRMFCEKYEKPRCLDTER